VTTLRPRAPERLLIVLVAVTALSLLHPVTRARLPVPISLLLIAWTGVLGTIAWRSGSRRWHIERIGQRWHLNALDVPPDRLGRSGSTLREATLLRGGFRAGSHVVMHFRDDGDRRLTLVVWRDAVEPETFSRLHLAMLATTENTDP